MNVSKTLIASALALGMIGGTTATASAHNAPAPSPQVVRSSQSCDAYAKDYANYRAGNRSTRVAAGGLIGAAAGGLLGGYFFGAPITGAVLGAGAGIVIQSAVHQPQWEAEYNNAFSACIYGAPLSTPWVF